MAGRTASAFTAQIGSMKANEEIDAIRTLGLNPIELLVVPRVLALLISLPLLTFVAMICGIVGGAVVCALSGYLASDVPFAAAERHRRAAFHRRPGQSTVLRLPDRRHWLPEGFKVSGSARSVGAHTTSSVVQSIFVVIVLDAVAALFFMEMGW